MFATLQELRDALRGFRESLDGWLVNSLANAFLRTTIASVSTEDSGEQLLVDRTNVYAASEERVEQSSTEVGRAEMAGHLVIPRLGEPALMLGDPSNAAYLPLASGKYRPSGGQPGDSAIYSLSDDQQAVLWQRQNGTGTWQSGGSARAELNVDGTLTLDSAGGGHVELDKAEPRVRAKTTLHADHFAGNDLIPVATPGSALGTSPPGTVFATGTDAAMTLVMEVTDPAAAPGLLCTIVFGGAYDGEPHLMGPFPKSVNLATPPPAGVAGALFAVATPSTVLLFTTLPFTPGVYRLSFGVMGNKA